MDRKKKKKKLVYMMHLVVDMADTIMSIIMNAAQNFSIRISYKSGENIIGEFAFIAGISIPDAL